MSSEATALDHVREGIAALRSGDLEAARQRFDQAIGQDPGHAPAHWHRGGVAWRSGRWAEAASHFDRARHLDPANPGYAVDAASAHYRAGALAVAGECCEAALALHPNIDAAYQMLSEVRLPGPGYLELLPRIIDRLRPRTYLEIGVASGDSIARLPAGVRAIGIDPEPAISHPLPPTTSIVPATSDEYFATHDVRAELGGLPVDVAFIDGMHRFEFALRDFANLERHCAPGSTILIHDCCPLDRLTAERERQTGFWSGDIWRLVVALRRFRPDLAVNVIATAPTGLGVVRRLDPASRLLEREYAGIIEEMLEVDYAVLDGDRAGLLGLCANDWPRIDQLLA